MPSNRMNRRGFLTASTAAAALSFSTAASSEAAVETHSFKLDYAPHIGMFRNLGGEDPVDQIHFMADAGFKSLEDNPMARRPVEEQERIAQALAERDMRLGVFVAHADFERVTFASEDPALREEILADMRKAVEVAKRVNAKWCTVVPGLAQRHREWDFQTATVIENLRRCAEICEPEGLIMVLEPIAPWVEAHTACFLTKIPQAYMLCKAVDSPSCKILNDLYHQQITEGNLIENIDAAWDEIAYFQIGDHPGRNEPGTGEINYRNIFRHIHAKGYDGVMGMEHGRSLPGEEGERALLKAYAEADDF